MTFDTILLNHKHYMHLYYSTDLINKFTNRIFWQHFYTFHLTFRDTKLLQQQKQNLIDISR